MKQGNFSKASPTQKVSQDLKTTAWKGLVSTTKSVTFILRSSPKNLTANLASFKGKQISGPLKSAFV